MSTSVTLSAVMIAKDASATIGESLLSVRFCDEIVVVVDERSSDATLDIARELADRVEVMPWAGYGPAKRAAIGLSRGAWVLVIDADERITPELGAAIRAAVKDSPPDVVAYRLRRRTRFLGRWMRFGDWGRDRVTRLFRRGGAEMSGDLVHESIAASGRVATLSGILLHEGDQTVEEYLTRRDMYTTLAAEALHRRGTRCLAIMPHVRAVFKFVQAYLLRLGMLDGRQGFVLAWRSAGAVYLKYSKLRELGKRTS